MIRKRHTAIGIKQVIRLEWIQKTANLVLAGLDAKTIRPALHELLFVRQQHGLESVRGKTSRTQVVNILMQIWVSPDPILIPFRDASLAFLQKYPSMSFPIHWGMMCAIYPFWFNVARQTGRLLSLQHQVTQIQIISRLKEQYGDRQTISRYGRYVLRSFVDWGALKDSSRKGCYEKFPPVHVTNSDLVSLMFESVLHAIPESKGVLSLVLNNPGFFPFEFPAMTGNFASQYSPRLNVVRHGLDDELINLTTATSTR